MAMKLLSLISLIFCSQYIQGQMGYQVYSGKVNGLTIGTAVGSLNHEAHFNQINYQSIQVGYCHMIRSGIYTGLGYNLINPITPLTSERQNSISQLNTAHAFNGYLLFQKKLLTTIDKKKNNRCFKQYLSLILAPEYTYFLSTKQFQNNNSGEISLRMGLGLFNVWGGNQAKSFVWETYYRRGYTPFITQNSSTYFRNEIGVQLRILFRQRYDFTR